MIETLAARMRAEYVGDDAIAFDELKPEVRARWERVAAVANGAGDYPGDGWAGECPPPPPIRVPFSDALHDAQGYKDDYERTRAELKAVKAHSESLTNALIEAKRQRDTSESKLRSIELPRVNSYAFIKALDDAREATRNHNSGPYGAKEKCPKCFGTGKVFVAGGPERVCTDCLVPNGEPSNNTGELPALDERDALKARVAELEEGLVARTNTRLMDELAALRAELEAMKAEREADTVPVKVKLPDVEDVNGHLIKHNFSTTPRIEMAEALRFAAENAVIDVPAGVPPIHSGPTRAEAEEKWETVAGHMTMPARAFIDWLLPQLPTERAEMPTPNDLARIIRRHATVERWDHVTAEAILAALRPWFRTPTGWELDVEPRVEYLDDHGVALIFHPHTIDFIKSRIRPTFECKRCAKLSEYRKIVIDGAEEVRNRIDAARAALEVE